MKTIQTMHFYFDKKLNEWEIWEPSKANLGVSWNGKLEEVLLKLKEYLEKEAKQ